MIHAAGFQQYVEYVIISVSVTAELFLRVAQ